VRTVYTMKSRIFKSGNSLAVRLPKRLDAKPGEVTIRKEGHRWIIEPMVESKWPEGFFETNRIEDPKVERAAQGVAPEIDL